MNHTAVNAHNGQTLGGVRHLIIIAVGIAQPVAAADGQADVFRLCHHLIAVHNADREAQLQILHPVRNTMAAVPLVAVAFAVTSGFGLEKLLQEALYSADINQTLIDTLMDGADNIIKAARSGVFGMITALSFVWLIIWMMNRVEKVFNNVWHVRKPRRKALKSYGIDIIIMILIPFIIIIFFAGTVVYSHVLDLIPHGMGITDTIKSFLSWCIFGGVAVMTLSAMYKFIPATYVNYRYALKAAIWAGIAFTLLQYLYLETQVMVVKLNAVYGAVAAIPLFMIWLRLGWLIILYGAQFSYSFQKVAESDKEIVEV